MVALHTILSVYTVSVLGTLKYFQHTYRLTYNLKTSIFLTTSVDLCVIIFTYICVIVPYMQDLLTSYSPLYGARKATPAFDLHCLVAYITAIENLEIASSIYSKLHVNGYIYRLYCFSHIGWYLRFSVWRS